MMECSGQFKQTCFLALLASVNEDRFMSKTKSLLIAISNWVRPRLGAITLGRGLLEAAGILIAIVVGVFAAFQYETSADIHKSQVIKDSWETVREETVESIAKGEALQKLASLDEELADIDLSCEAMGGDAKEDSPYCDPNPTYLRGLDLQSVNLERANFSNTDLSCIRVDKCTNFSDSDLTRAKFNRANLEGANLARATLDRADFVAAELVNANLSEAKLNEANLREANLNGADLEKANLVAADLVRADLAGANLTGVNLVDAKLAGANLTGVDLTVAELGNVDFKGANLAEANLAGENLVEVNLREAKLNGANLAGAELRDADLVGADLAAANLSGAELGDADLSGANLAGAELERANFKWADLSGAGFVGASFVDANLSRAYLWRANLEGANFEGVYMHRAYLANANISNANFTDVSFGVNLMADTWVWEGSMPESVSPNYVCAADNPIMTRDEYAAIISRGDFASIDFSKFFKHCSQPD